MDDIALKAIGELSETIKQVLKDREALIQNQ